jgi:hypothetical protein
MNLFSCNPEFELLLCINSIKIKGVIFNIDFTISIVFRTVKEAIVLRECLVFGVWCIVI